MGNTVITDTSQVTKKNIIAVLIASALFILLLGLSIYKWVVDSIHQPIEVFINLMFLVVIISRIQPRYVVEVDKTVFRITKKSWLGNKVYEVPYKIIFGIYRYKAQLIRAVSYRYTYRLNSMLDNRTVWGLAYRLENKKGKVQNHRIYFKANKAVMDALAEKLPNKVDIPEDQVAITLLKADPDWDKD